MRNLSLLAAALLLAGPAIAEDRAVVIWNRQYDNAPALADTDAAQTAGAVQQAGFHTVSGTDMTIDQIRTALADLLRPDDAPGRRVVLLSGHFLHGGSDSWFMGTDADDPGLMAAGTQGVPLSMVLDLLKDARPGAVLLLGPDGGGMPHGAGLQDGIGPLNPPEGVAVIQGPPASLAAAATALLKPGVSVGDVAGADRELVLAGDSDPHLVLAAGAEGGTDDRDLWAQAAARDDTAGYRDYLARYPGGAYAEAAQTRLRALDRSQEDRDLWADAAAANTIAAYDDYLSRHPQGQFADAARKRRAELDQPAPASPAIQAPRAEARQQAAPGQQAESRLNLSHGDRVAIQRRLNALGYATGGADGVFGSRTRSAIRGWQQSNGYQATGYLTQGQLGPLRQQANAAMPSREQLDREYWDQTGAKGGTRNLQAYLDRYPDGVHAQTARERLARAQDRNDDDDDRRARDQREDRAWSRARQADTVQAYNQYLQDWPRGEHAAQARQRRTRLLEKGQIGTGVIGLDTIIRELIK